MTALVTGLLSQVWPYILAGFAALAVLWQQRRAGAAAERAKQAKREEAARDIADQVDNDIGAMPPADARKDLGKWGRGL